MRTVLKSLLSSFCVGQLIYVCFVDRIENSVGVNENVVVIRLGMCEIVFELVSMAMVVKDDEDDGSYDYYYGYGYGYYYCYCYGYVYLHYLVDQLFQLFL